MNTTLAAQLQAAAERLLPLHPRLTTLGERTLAIAEAAVEGFVLYHYLGEQRAYLGRQNINWLSKTSVGEGQSSFFAYSTPFILPLAQAYQVTRDERYAEAARDYFTEFMTAWPLAGVGQNPNADSTLCLSGRNANWAHSLHLLAASPAFDEALLARIIAFITGQFAFLVPNIKSVINWRVFEARSLLNGCLFLPFIGPANDWRQHAVRILNDAWYRQFLPDGVHYERNPIYHGGMAGTFRDLLRVGRLLPELGLVMTVDRLLPMYDFSLACTKPSGYLCGIHDSQSEFTGHLRDGRHTAGHKGVNKTQEWEDFRREFDLPLTRPATSQVYPNAGLAFLRTAWDEDAAWLSFDASTWGSGHCHLSRNALQLHAHRQSMVIDPGWLDYDNSDWGTYGKSTGAHSTCTLNGLNQSQTNPRCFVHHGVPGYDALFSTYEGGYWNTTLAWTFSHARQGIWAEHGRLVFWIQDRFAFVADSMFRLPHQLGDPETERPSYECTWQLAPSAQITLEPEQNRARAQWRDAGLLLLTPIRPEGSRYDIHEGEKSPLRGWVPGEGQRHPAPQLVLNTPRMDRQHDYYVSALVPYAGQTAPEVTVEAKSPMGQTGFLRLRWADGTEDTVYWACNLNMMLGTWPDFETDSSLVHLRKDASGKVISGCCVNGTFIAPFSPQNRPKPETFRFP
jgi:hypothetical protein